MAEEEVKESLHPTNAAETEAAAAASEEGEPAGQEQASGKSRPEPVQSTLSPVGKPLGKGLGTIASPVGGLVEPLVGGVMKSGKGFGDTVGVGAGNQDPKKLEEMREERKDVGGKEQTAQNPLGLGDP
ncbi:MAG: hypothetical protein LQ343_004257 [Gyalolechia ehrenbergii]|nr:MAG: hypothetical protein LQ343_004257 [Gyalolechia ehrenbergii]